MSNMGIKLEEIEVNGMDIEVSSQKLTAHQILELAKKKGAMPGDPNGYFLQGDKGEYKQDDEVNIEEDHRFLTIPNKPTPVA